MYLNVLPVLWKFSSMLHPVLYSFGPELFWNFLPRAIWTHIQGVIKWALLTLPVVTATHFRFSVFSFVRSFVLILTRDNGSEPKKVYKGGYPRGGRVAAAFYRRCYTLCGSLSVLPYWLSNQTAALYQLRLRRGDNQRDKELQGWHTNWQEEGHWRFDGQFDWFWRYQVGPA
jgi:hypothetical protein